MAISERSAQQLTTERVKDTDQAPNHRGVEWWIGIAVVSVVSIAYLWYFLDRGWIPHDEGTLAQGAERVLSGEMPHRDFVERYTGGLTYINAFAFRVFGVHLLALRYALFVAFIVWIPVFYYATTRIVSPFVGIAVTLIAVFWSVPNYPAAMPSWYNLFLATGGVAALLKYIDSENRRWVFAAGFLGGLSVLSKMHGMLFVAAGLLFLLFHEARAGTNSQDAPKSDLVLRLFPAAVLIAAGVALLAIGLSRRSWLDVYQFAIPGFAMVAIVGRTVFRSRGPSITTAVMITRSAAAYLFGASIPVVAFLVPYAVLGAIPDLLRDVVLDSTRSLEGASVIPPLPLGLIGLGLAFFVAIRLPDNWRTFAILQGAVAIAAIVLLLVPRRALMFEPLIWAALAESGPVVILFLAFLTARSEKHPAEQIAQSRTVLLGSVAAFCSLVQYPFAAHVYFSYSFPLLLLAVVAVVQASPWFRTRAVQGLACFFLLFGALYITPMKLPGLLGPVADEDTAVLDLPRGGLRVTREDAENYPVAVRLVQAHATSGVTYAGPDAPEFYFLSGLKNPTRVFFDYQSQDTLFYSHLLRSLDSLGVYGIALRRRVVHSPPLQPRIADSLASRFPFARDVGRFTIRWR